MSMSYNKVAVIIVVALLLVTGRSYGFNMLTHLWLGEHTLNIWESYDPEFSMAVSEDDDNETRRMYRIGLMLPDLLDPSAQNAIREVIDTIYEKLDIDERFGFDLRDNGIGVSGSASVYLDARSALWISSNVYQSVQEPITFNGNYPNENMQKLWQMVDYIHNTNAPPSHKALIYGAFMHVLQDMYAHMVLQPSLLGYPYVISSDTAYMRLNRSDSFDDIPDSKISPLFFFENYYETFVPTYIDTTELLMIFMKLFPQNFTFDVDSAYDQVYTWQYIYHPAVDSFVSAARAVGYATPSLTYERLHAYLHGAGILTFMIYQGDGGIGSGRYINLSPTQFLTAVATIVEHEYHISYMDIDFCVGNWCGIEDYVIPLGLLNAVADGIINTAIQYVYQAVPDFLMLGFGISSWLLNVNSNLPWPEYLESSERLQEVISIAEAIVTARGQDPDSVLASLYALKEAVKEWERYGQMNPARREYYQYEPQRILSLIPLLYQSFESYTSNSPDIAYGNNRYPIARKAGILGGIFPVDITSDYYKQPGILDMHFEVGGEYIYDSAIVPIEGPSVDIRLIGEIVTFGNTQNCVIVKNSTHDTTIVCDTISGIQHSFLSIPFDAQWALNHGYNEVSFIVKTQSVVHPTRYFTMMDADYSEQYWAHPEIQQNAFYRRYFKNGNPLRNENEDPLQEPMKFWPYILPLTPVLTELNKPSDLSATASSNLESITLTWTDRSNYEDGYRLQRREPGGDWHNLATLQQNATSYTDNSVDPFSDYEYRIWAFKDNGVVSDTVYIKTTTDGLVRAGADVDMGHHATQIAVNNGRLHTVFAHGDTIFYSYSTDWGHTWSTPYIVGYGYHPSIASKGNYTVIVWDRDSSIFYRPMVGDQFLPESHFKPTGTFMTAYSPAVMIYGDSALVVFGANNNHAYFFVFYKSFPVTAPPSGAVTCDMMWAYSHKLDSLVVKGISGYGSGNGRYTAVTFWGYGYIWGNLVRVYEKPVASTEWRSVLEDTMEYISNPVVDSAKGKLYVALGGRTEVKVMEKGISESGNWNMIANDGGIIGPLFIDKRGRVVMAAYRRRADSTMKVLTLSYDNQIHWWRPYHSILGFDGVVPAGLYAREIYNWAEGEYYYAVMPIDRGYGNADGRYLKNRLVYSYIYEQSPLNANGTKLPDRFSVMVRGVVRKDGILDLQLNVPKRGAVNVAIYDVTGRILQNQSRMLDAGYHQISFKLDAPSGVYFVRAEYGNKKLIRKFMVVR